jgi:hypothetical protein
MSRNVEYRKDMLSILERCNRAQHKALAAVQDFNEQYKLCNRDSYEEMRKKKKKLHFIQVVTRR